MTDHACPWHSPDILPAGGPPQATAIQLYRYVSEECWPYGDNPGQWYGSLAEWWATAYEEGGLNPTVLAARAYLVASSPASGAECSS